MRVLMVAPYPDRSGIVRGGIASATSALVPALAGLEEIEGVTVVCFRPGASPDVVRDGKVAVHHLAGQPRLRAATHAWLDQRAIGRLVERIAPDVVHGQGVDANGDLAVRAGPPSVVTVHGLPNELRLEGRSARARLLERRAREILARADTVVSLTPYAERALPGPVRGRQVRIANPVAEEFFGLGLEKLDRRSEPRLLYAGVVRPLKDVVGLVEAFALARRQVPEARLTIVGPQPDPAYLASVRQRIDQLGVRDAVDLRDVVDPATLRGELAQSRAVVLSSRQENAPTIVAQAMAAGKPFVATRVGGVPEMVEEGATGHLVDAGDVDGLAQRMVDVLTDQEHCLVMGARAHALAIERYHAAEVARRTLSMYDDCLSDPRSLR